MSFLDNIDNNLKNLEGQLERGDPAEEKRRRAHNASSAAAAPSAEALRNSPFTQAFLSHAVRLGHSSRIKVHMAWIHKALRVEARERRMELVPGPDGISAVLMVDGTLAAETPVHLDSDDAETLARQFLGI